MNPWERFVTVARGGQADRVPVAMIVDSPWLPGYAGVDTLDYFLKPDLWLKVNLALLDRFPDIAWIPGFWVEYGMAAEPSAFGSRIVWHRDRPPSIEAVRGGLAMLYDIEPPDPQEHGMMPLILQLTANAEKELLPRGHNIKMVCARGPFAVSGWVLGITEFMTALVEDPEKSHQFLNTMTTTIINWLRAQLDVLKAPEGIMLLDDIIGMISPKMFEDYVRPYYARIFDAFKGMVRVLHNDTPCPHLFAPLSTLGFDVFNFSHETDIAFAQSKMPNIALMGNVPPLSLMVRGTPEQVENWARECIQKTNGRGLILSAGGGVSPGTPAWALDAVVKATLN